MHKHHKRQDRKRSREARAETLRRREVRRVKYAGSVS